MRGAKTFFAAHESYIKNDKIANDRVDMNFDI